MTKYIKEEVFLNRKGEPWVIFTNSAEDVNPSKLISADGINVSYTAWISDMVRSIAGAYIPQQGQILTFPEIRIENKALDIFEEGPTVGLNKEFFVLEDAHIKILTKVFEWAIPIMKQGWQREAEGIMVMLAGVDELPTEEESELFKELVHITEDDKGHTVIQTVETHNQQGEITQIGKVVGSDS